MHHKERHGTALNYQNKLSCHLGACLQNYPEEKTGRKSLGMSCNSRATTRDQCAI